MKRCVPTLALLPVVFGLFPLLAPAQSPVPLAPAVTVGHIAIPAQFFPPLYSSWPVSRRPDSNFFPYFHPDTLQLYPPSLDVLFSDYPLVIGQVVDHSFIPLDETTFDAFDSHDGRALPGEAQLAVLEAARKAALKDPAVHAAMANFRQKLLVAEKALRADMRHDRHLATIIARIPDMELVCGLSHGYEPPFAYLPDTPPQLYPADADPDEFADDVKFQALDPGPEILETARLEAIKHPLPAAALHQAVLAYQEAEKALRLALLRDPTAADIVLAYPYLKLSRDDFGIWFEDSMFFRGGSAIATSPRPPASAASPG
jgi:hypothetical protein